MNIAKVREELRYGKSIYEMNLRVCYYARVSTDKDDQLNSLDNQRKYFEEMIKENKNWTFVEGFIDEGISGTAVKKRTSFLKMIEASKLGEIDLILTKEISRFSRNTVDSIKYTEDLLRNGVVVYFLSDNLNTIQEDAEFRLTIMSSLAQDEVRKLSERVKFGIRRMIKDRKLIGSNLTGYYKKNGKYEINIEEAKMIRYLFENYVTGINSLKKIGEDLFKMGYKNTKGGLYSQVTLVKFLTNPRYKGYYTARMTEVEDYKTHKKKKVDRDKQIIEKDEKIPAIVSEELWDKCNNLYKERKKKRERHILNSEEILEHGKYSLLIYCHECGNIFIRNGGSNRKKNPVWTCKTYRIKGVNVCKSPIIKEDILDKIFIKIFSKIIDKDILIDKMIKEYNNLIKNDTNKDNSKKIEEINRQKDKLLDLYLKGLIDEEIFKKRDDKFNNEINLLNKDNDKKENVNIKEYLLEILDIKKELGNLIKLFIEKIEIEKINNDRKKIRIYIYFKIKKEMVVEEINL